MEAHKPGKLIVLDGLDGCGKSTQFLKLQTALREMGKTVHGISFPDYKSPAASLVRMYLDGTFSDTPGGVNAYAASSFYAVDRYANYKLNWENDYLTGTWILASRYTTSNAIHQMSKLSEDQWDGFLNWLEDYEYEKLGLPRPDLVLYLSVPLAVSQKLLIGRYDGNAAKRDIHEADLQYLAQCSHAAAYAAKKCGWSCVSCTVGDEMKPTEEIRDMLLAVIQNRFSDI